AVGVAGRPHRGGVVDRGAGPQAETGVRQPHPVAQRREHQHRHQVEQEDGGDRERGLVVARADDRRHGRDGRAAADRGADADQHRQLPGHAQQPPQRPRGEEGHRQRPQHHAERVQPGARDLTEVEPEAQAHDRPLQELAAGETDARVEGRARREQRPHQHAEHDRRHRGAHQRQRHADAPGQRAHHPGQSEAPCNHRPPRPVGAAPAPRPLPLAPPAPARNPPAGYNRGIPPPPSPESPMFPRDARIEGYDPELAQAIADERQRQEDHVELIASENYASPRVMEAQGSVLTNKYAEGYPGKRYYGGCEFVDVAERLAIDRVKELFGADYANVQPHSGSQANQAVYLALLQPGDTILGMSLAHGGHLTHGAKVNISGKLFNAVQYGVDDEGLIDYDEVERLALEHKPKMVVAGFSAYSQVVDWARFRAIADKVGAYLFVDMAHVAGLV